MRLREIGVNTAIRASKINEIIREINRLHTFSGSAGVNIASDAGGISVAIRDFSSGLPSSLKVRCRNISGIYAKRFTPLIIETPIFPQTSPDFYTEILLDASIPNSEGDELKTLVIADEPIPPGAIGLCCITGPALSYIYGPSVDTQIVGVDPLGAEPSMLLPDNPGARLIWYGGPLAGEDYGFGIILLGADTGGGDTLAPGEQLIEVVATLPPIPTEEGVYKKVLWGKSTTITGGTGDDGIFNACWLDTRWHPERPTTLSCAPGV